jgi:hypothetical protein
MLRLGGNKAKLPRSLHHRALEFVIGHRLILTRRADFSTLNPLAAEHALYLDRGDGSTETRAARRRGSEAVAAIAAARAADIAPIIADHWQPI